MPSTWKPQILNLLQNCTFKQLKQLHAFIITTSLDNDIEISSKLLRRSTEFGSMDYATQIFTHLRTPEITLWNAMIRGFSYNGPFEIALYMFDKMPQRDLKPNNFTYPFAIDSCAQLGWFHKGKMVHSRVIKSGFYHAFRVSESLFNMYIKMGRTGSLGDVQKVFDEMCVRNVEVYNKMIGEYVKFGDVEKAAEVFDDMPQRDVVSWNSMISGFLASGDVEKAKDLFTQMPQKNVVSWTSMIKAYASSGNLELAREFFEKMPERNVVSWNCMISCYAQQGKYEEALNLFVQMISEGVEADAFTYVSALSASSHLGALEFGKWIESRMKDWVQMGVIVGTSLIEMYAKCGNVDRAFSIFIKMGKKDVFSWNVMIKSFAINGRTEDAMKLFFSMQKHGLNPNEYTFSSALFACSHGGLVQEGQRIFRSMERDFGIKPRLEHFGCLIDLLGRKGQVEEAISVVEEMPFEPDIAIWGALLAGCKVRNDFKLAEEVMERANDMNLKEAGVFVALSNMYASEGQWLDASTTRERMERKKIWKETGYSSVI